MSKETDRLDAETFQQLALVFPTISALCDQMSMDVAIGYRKAPNNVPLSEHAALLTRKGMQVTRPRRRKQV